MSRTTIARLFIGAGLALIAGATLAVAAIWIAIANDVFVMNGQDIIGLDVGASAWPLLGAGIVGGIAMIGGLIAGFVAWIGALFNTWQLDSKGWFVGLLLLGIFNLGFFAMVAYLLAGPDGESRTTRRPAQAAARG
jgi:hypothetical protein